MRLKMAVSCEIGKPIVGSNKKIHRAAAANRIHQKKETHENVCLYLTPIKLVGILGGSNFCRIFKSRTRPPPKTNALVWLCFGVVFFAGLAGGLAVWP